MEKQQSTTKGFAILGFTNLFCKFLALVYLPLQTMILGYDGNSLAANGYKIYTFIFSLSNAGLPVAISKLVAEQEAVGNYRGASKVLRYSFFSLMALGAACSLFLLAGAKWISHDYLHQPDAMLMIRAFSPALLFTSVTCTFRGYFQGRKNMMPTAVSQIVEQLFNTVCTVLFAWVLIRHGLAWGVAGTAVGTVAGAAAAAIFLLYVFALSKGQRSREIRLSRYDGPELERDQIFRQILRYSIPAIVNTVATCAPDLIDANSVVSRLMAGGMSYKNASTLNSVYSYQYERPFTIAIAFSTAIVTALIPAISSALAVNDFKTIRKKISDGYKAIFFITVPSVAGLTFLARPIITLVFINKNMGWQLLVAGAWTAIFFVIMSNQTAVLIAVGRPVVASLNLIIGMAVKLLLNYSLLTVPCINIYGAIAGTAVGWIIASLLNQYAININLGMRVPYLRHLIKPTAASLLMGAAAFVLYNVLNFVTQHAGKILGSDIAILLTVGFAAPFYFVLMVLWNGISGDDILRLPMGRKIYKIAILFPYLRRKLVR